MPATLTTSDHVHIPIGDAVLEGGLLLPENAPGIVVFAQACGALHGSNHHRFVAHTLNASGLGTLLVDLLSRAEECNDFNHELTCDIPLLTERLVSVTKWLLGQPRVEGLGLGYLGHGAGCAAAVHASFEFPREVQALVCRSGRLVLPLGMLGRVRIPTQLMVGEWDDLLLQHNRNAIRELRCPKSLEIIPHATHCFEEPGALEHVAMLATTWFATHLRPLDR